MIPHTLYVVAGILTVDELNVLARASEICRKVIARRQAA